MALILPLEITRPVRNKACIFPSEDACELSSSDINSIIRRNPYSFNNIFFKPYIKRLSGIKKYNAIRRQYLKFKKNGIIAIDENPSFYIYNITNNEGKQFVGILGKIHHEDYEQDNVVKIEKSNAVRVREKHDIISNTGFTSKPITVLYEQVDEIDEIITKYKSRIPLFGFTKNNGFVHEVWQVLDSEDLDFLSSIFSRQDKFYIIDDDDKFDALHQIYKEKIDKNRRIHTGQEAYNYFPAFLISNQEAKIYEYKKGVPIDYSKSMKEVLELLRDDFYIEEIQPDIPPQRGEILLYGIESKYKLKLKKKKNLPDSIVFERFVLEKLDIENEIIENNSLKYCSGNRSLKCVENHLHKKNCKFGFIIHPIDFEIIKQNAEDALKIPNKSMYVEPRLLKGLFIYEI